MKRTMMDDLKAWKNRRRRKPLLLKGARRTGKTWLLKEFGRREFKGALTERYVCQQLAYLGLEPAYWSSDTGRAEVDFAVELGGEPVPVEVKAAENLKSKSLKVARDKFGLERCMRTSLSGYRDEGWLVNVPLWAVSTIA